MSTSILGSGTFDDLCLPLKGKSEWGMDTLARKVSGARSLAEAYIATLAQGQIYPPGSSSPYYLQTWDPDDNPSVATITLNYKGLLTGGTPLPDIQSEIVSTTGTTTKDYSSENDGVGRLYGTDFIWSMESPAGPSDNGRSFKGERKRYAMAATMQFNYKAIQSQIRYISVGEPSGPEYTTVNVHFDPSFDNAKIATADGSTFGIERMVFFELQPVQLAPRVISFSSRHVIGTPYWEVDEVLRMELGTLP